MDQTFAVINDLEERRVIRRYALSGNLAFMFYLGPIVSYDLEVLCLMPEGRRVSGVYDYFRGKESDDESEHILIASVPVKFVEASSELQKEAVENAVEHLYKEMKVRVVSYEYLIALSLTDGKAQIRHRLRRAITAVMPDLKVLNDIVERHKLTIPLKLLNICI